MKRNPIFDSRTKEMIRFLQDHPGENRVFAACSIVDEGKQKGYFIISNNKDDSIEKAKRTLVNFLDKEKLDSKNYICGRIECNKDDSNAHQLDLIIQSKKGLSGKAVETWTSKILGNISAAIKKTKISDATSESDVDLTEEEMELITSEANELKKSITQLIMKSKKHGLNFNFDPLYSMMDGMTELLTPTISKVAANALISNCKNKLRQYAVAIQYMYPELSEEKTQSPDREDFCHYIKSQALKLREAAEAFGRNDIEHVADSITQNMWEMGDRGETLSADQFHAYEMKLFRLKSLLNPSSDESKGLSKASLQGSPSPLKDSIKNLIVRANDLKNKASQRGNQERFKILENLINKLSKLYNYPDSQLSEVIIINIEVAIDDCSAELDISPARASSSNIAQNTPRPDQSGDSSEGSGASSDESGDSSDESGDSSEESGDSSEESGDSSSSSDESDHSAVTSNPSKTIAQNSSSLARDDIKILLSKAKDITSKAKKRGDLEKVVSLDFLTRKLDELYHLPDSKLSEVNITRIKNAIERFSNEPETISQPPLSLIQSNIKTLLIQANDLRNKHRHSRGSQKLLALDGMIHILNKQLNSPSIDLEEFYRIKTEIDRYWNEVDHTPISVEDIGKLKALLSNVENLIHRISGYDLRTFDEIYFQLTSFQEELTDSIRENNRPSNSEIAAHLAIITNHISHIEQLQDEIRSLSGDIPEKLSLLLKMAMGIMCKAINHGNQQIYDIAGNIKKRLLHLITSGEHYDSAELEDMQNILTKISTSVETVYY